MQVTKEQMDILNILQNYYNVDSVHKLKKLLSGELIERFGKVICNFSEDESYFNIGWELAYWWNNPNE